jgi:hypothetical protein
MVCFWFFADGATGGGAGLTSPIAPIVGFAGRGGIGLGGGFAPLATGAPAATGLATRNECPHLGQRIFRPVGGTRRSSI